MSKEIIKFDNTEIEKQISPTEKPNFYVLCRHQ